MGKYRTPLCVKKLVFITSFSLQIMWAWGQGSTFAPGLHASTEFALRLHYGVIYAQSNLVQNTAGAHPRGAEFEVSKQFTDKVNWDNYRCYPRMGLVFSYIDFNTNILGNSYSASYFLEPNFRLGQRAGFFVRGAVGLSYLTNPHDSIKNPANQSYSLPVNVYLSLGVGLNYRLGTHTALSVMASFQHNSNGGVQLPNHGINFPTASVGIKYNLAKNNLPVYSKTQTDGWKAQTHGWRKSKPAYDAGVYISPKPGYRPLTAAGWVGERKFVEGAFVQVSKQVSTLHAVTAMIEVYHDGAMASIKRNIGDNSTSTLAGFMAGHEFVFHRIFFSQQLGVYIFKQTAYFFQQNPQVFPGVYHRWGLRYKLNTHMYIGVNMLAHNQVADFADARLVYRW